MNPHGALLEETYGKELGSHEDVYQRLDLVRRLLCRSWGMEH
jgi:hypothetical protein